MSVILITFYLFMFLDPGSYLESFSFHLKKLFYHFLTSMAAGNKIISVFVCLNMYLSWRI